MQWKLPPALEHLTYEEKRELLASVEAGLLTALIVDRFLRDITVKQPLDVAVEPVLDAFAGAMDGEES